MINNVYMLDGGSAHHECESQVPVGLVAAAKNRNVLDMVAPGKETCRCEGCTKSS
jgi:hypothetical protein